MKNRFCIFEDLFRNDRSMLSLLDADHTFLNERLADYYDIPGVRGNNWRRVGGIRNHSRGGILAMGSVLSKQSGASRTSPVLRGNWVVETLLGEKLPKPPPNVPQIPDDETALKGLTVRELTEKHRQIKQCAVCHDRIDPFGFALESFDAVGRFRKKDASNRPIDTRVELPDKTQFTGLEGLRNYLLTQRREQFLRIFCRKLLGYALGRKVTLSDGPLIDKLLSELKQNDYRFSVAAITIVQSQQFRFHRGLESTKE